MKKKQIARIILLIVFALTVLIFVIIYAQKILITTKV